MNWHVIFKSHISLVVACAVLMMTSTALWASEADVLGQDIIAHDYIMDRQQEFNCSMVQLDDGDLSDVVASGFSKFDLNYETGITRIDLNIETRSFVEIDSLKMGYYNSGWDEDWTAVSIGSATEDLVCNGLFIEASFTNITDPATRTLNSIKIGTPSMTGPLSATFNSFSGHIENPTDGVLVDGYRLNLGTRTIQSTNSEFYVQLSGTGPQIGWWFYWNNATITP